jgi:hypothetical protein
VNLEGTKLKGRALIDQRVETTDTNWYFTRVRNNVFEGRGDAFNLGDILRVFVLWWWSSGDGEAS